MKRATYKTQAELAAALDIQPGTLSRLLRHVHWPVRRTAPWNAQDVATVQRWREQSLREDRAKLDHGHGLLDELRELRMRKLGEEIRRLHALADSAEVAARREQGELVPLEAVRTNWARRALTIKQSLQGLAQTLSRLLANRDEADIERELTAAFRALCQNYADGLVQPGAVADEVGDDVTHNNVAADAAESQPPATPAE